MSVTDGSVSVTTPVVSTQPTQGNEDVAKGVPSGSRSPSGGRASTTSSEPALTKATTRSYPDTLIEEEEGQRKTLKAFWSLLRDDGYESW